MRNANENRRKRRLRDSCSQRPNDELSAFACFVPPPEVMEAFALLVGEREIPPGTDRLAARQAAEATVQEAVRLAVALRQRSGLSRDHFHKNMPSMLRAECEQEKRSQG